MEEVCGWLQSTYIDGGEPRERRRALAKKCDQLTTALQPGEVSGGMQGGQQQEGGGGGGLSLEMAADPAVPEGFSGGFQMPESDTGEQTPDFFGGYGTGVPSPTPTVPAAADASMQQPMSNGHVQQGDASMQAPAADDFGGFGGASGGADFGSFDAPAPTVDDGGFGSFGDTSVAAAPATDDGFGFDSAPAPAPAADDGFGAFAETSIAASAPGGDFGFDSAPATAAAAAPLADDDWGQPAQDAPLSLGGEPAPAEPPAVADGGFGSGSADDPQLELGASAGFSTGSGLDESAAPTAAPAAAAFPLGWESRQSRSTGETYYVNIYTEESQYELPTEIAPGAPEQEAATPTPRKDGDGLGEFGDVSADDSFGDFDATAAPVPSVGLQAAADFGDFGEDFGTPRPGASDAFADQAAAGNSDSFDDFGDFGADTCTAGATAAADASGFGDFEADSQPAQEVAAGGDDFFGGDSAPVPPAPEPVPLGDFGDFGASEAAAEASGASSVAVPGGTRVAGLIAEERLQEALECEKYEASESDWTTLKAAYDEAKEDDELAEADRLRQEMLDAGWQPPKAVKAWAQLPPPEHLTLAAMRQDLETGLTADSGACAAFRSMYPEDDHFAQLAAQDLAAAAAGQAQALYWHGFFSSPLGSEESARTSLVKRWTSVLGACVSEVSAARKFVTDCLAAPNGEADLLDALTQPVPQLETYLLGVVEVVRVAARVGSTVSCHKPWIEIQAGVDVDTLSARLDEMKAQYSVLTATLSTLPPPAELFGGDGEWSLLTASGKSANAGFPGVAAVCALTLHELGAPDAAVHRTPVQWQCATYFAPCANLLANRIEGAPAAAPDDFTF